MKRYILILAISVLAFASCSKDESAPDVQGKSGIALDVVCSQMSPITKSVPKPGEDAYNENIIKTIDYYFYPEGKTNKPAVLHARVAPNALNQYTVNVSVDEAMLNTVLFPRPTNTCQVAVLVNYPGDHPAATTLAGLEALPLVLQLNENGKGKDQSEFVMFGIKEVELISRKATLIANPVVDVHRVACKITLDAYVVPSTIAPVQLIDGGTTYTLNQEWQPDLSGMYIYLENGVSNGVVNGDQEVTKPYKYFKYSQRPFTGEMATHKINGVDHDFHKSFPFYTYPQNWATADPKEPFLKLILPWTRVAGDDHEYNPDWETKPHSWGSIQKQFYYRILLPHDATGFVSNNWYHINLDVAILGSDIDDASVDIEGKYYVVPWGDAVPVEADIKGSRYLSVSQLDHIMYNTTRLEIPYVTSNKCKIISIEVRQKRYKSNNPSPTDPPYFYYTFPADSVNKWVTLDENNNIVINHSLNNNINDDSFDVAPYEYTFTIIHDDDNPNYSKTLTVLQYPAMFIEAVGSSGHTFLKTNRNNKGYPYVEYNDDGGENAYRYIGALLNRNNAMSSGENSNPNIYTINVTVLPDDYPYSIGDPRLKTGLSGTQNGSLVYRLNNLSNYKATDTNSMHLIAPVFKIASSYGQTTNLTYQGAAKRCASYQEDGYPAGRWRLPTEAEILYVMTLSARGKIPELFTPRATHGYWSGRETFLTRPDDETLLFISAKGVTPNNNRSYTINGRNYTMSVRCVYDSWYWGDGQVSKTTWSGYMTD